LYHHDPSARARIEIDEFQMKDPMTLVAVIAHTNSVALFCFGRD